ncbi:hypothetical protein FRC03_005952 [Tulasnella sp. 419]|nr:hypothetical protein FRC03_005952 [Tulasnella sp. 419]
MSSQKRSRSVAELTEPDEEVADSQASTMSLDDQISCGICFSVMENPFMIIPCLHSFDRFCLAEWWKSNTTCPTCKQNAMSARHAFQLSGIIDHYEAKRKTKRHALDNEAMSKAELFPMRRALNRFLALPGTQSQSQSQSQAGSSIGLGVFSLGSAMDYDDVTDSQRSVMEPLQDLRPGGTLIFPCPSCSSDSNVNTTGYVCPNPIPMPTPEQIAEEQEAQRPGGDAIRAPGRGDWRAALADAAANQIPWALSHVACSGCSAYIPRGWEPQKIKCSECGIFCCSNYDPEGCHSGKKLYARDRLSETGLTAYQLWNSMPGHLKANTHERIVFVQYLQDQNITMNALLEQLADLKREAELDDPLDDDAAPDDGANNSPDARWGQGVYLCDDGVRYLSREIYKWWVAERAKGLLPAAVRELDDCWYGIECRTQVHNPDHASRLKHVCENTSARPRR